MQCSEINNGTEFEKLKARLKDVVRKEKNRPRSIWPCLKRQGNLGVLRLIIVNIGLCYPYLQPIMEEMHEKFRENKKTTTRILKWLQAQFDSSGYELNHLFDVSGVVIGLKLQNKYGNLKNQLGSKCYKRLTKSCRCM